jgi:hypothetical protein
MEPLPGFDVIERAAGWAMKMARTNFAIEGILDILAREMKIITKPWTRPYMTRWVLSGQSGEGTGRAVYVHKFHRSDRDDMHDHPWPFVSVILWGGYWEKTPDYQNGWKNGDGPTKMRWYAPGRILVRPARWIHSVIIPDGSTATTLIFRGVKERSWGFYCPRVGYLPWRMYANNEKHGHGCGA